jgi:hypothetical protein
MKKKQNKDFDRKNSRRENIKNKNLDHKYGNDEDSMTYRNIKKELKKRKQEIQEEELWDDWGEYEDYR